MPRPKLYKDWLPAVYMIEGEGTAIRNLAATHNLRLADLQRKIYRLVIDNPDLLKDGEEDDSDK